METVDILKWQKKFILDQLQLKFNYLLFEIP
jgi:hypothetical protein